MEHATQYRSSIAYRAWVRPKPGPSDSTAKAIAATAANPAPVANHEGHRQHWAGNASDRSSAWRKPNAAPRISGGVMSATRASRGESRIPLPIRSRKRAAKTATIDPANGKIGFVNSHRACRRERAATNYARRNVPEPCDEAESDDTGAWIVPYVIPSTRYGDETTSTA